MAQFLDRSQLYLLLSRELPEDVYPFSADPAVYWHSSSLWAKAGVLEGCYTRAQQNYDNYWPQLADEVGIALHELAWFGVISTGLTLQERRDRVLAKQRAKPSMSNTDLTDIVKAELPPGTIVELVSWNEDVDGDGVGGTWYLGVSELGVDTFLGAYGSHAFPAGTDQCEMDGSEIGLTPDEWAEYQAQAYTYEVRIYEYTPTADELAAIERALNEAEPHRSRHIVLSNVDISEFALPYLPPLEELP